VLFSAAAQSSVVKRFSLFSVAAFLAATLTALAQLPEQAASKLALVHGTLINPADGKITPDATILIDGIRIAAVGSPNDVKLTPEIRRIDCSGKFILPGYIDTHVHFFQSGDLFTRPDVVDLTNVRPHQEEVAWIKSHLDDTFARYRRSGITSVVDVGGPMWNFEVRSCARLGKTGNRICHAHLLISVSQPTPLRSGAKCGNNPRTRRSMTSVGPGSTRLSPSVA